MTEAEVVEVVVAVEEGGLDHIRMLVHCALRRIHIYPANTPA